VASVGGVDGLIRDEGRCQYLIRFSFQIVLGEEPPPQKKQKLGMKSNMIFVIVLALQRSNKEMHEKLFCRWLHQWILFQAQTHHILELS